MKILSVMGFVASCCLIGFVPAAIAQNQNNNSELTCRAALEGTTIAEIQEADAQCCYVLEEAQWYTANNVLLRHSYQRADDGRKYLTVECAANGGTSEGNGNSSGDQSSGPTSSIILSSSLEGLPSSSSEPASGAPGNPGNDKPVGGAGESPNGDVSGFMPDPGTKGQSN